MLSAIQVVRCKSKPTIKRIVIHVAGVDHDMTYNRRTDTYVYEHAGHFSENKWEGAWAVGVMTMYMGNGMEIELYNSNRSSVRRGERIEITRDAFMTALRAIGWRWPKEARRG